VNQSEREAVLGLPDLERAKKFKELMLRHSWNQTELASNLKVTIHAVTPIMQLLKLCDAAQKLMDPSLPHGKRLSLVGALFLVTHTEERQLFMLEGIEDVEDRAFQRTHFKSRLAEFQRQTRERLGILTSHPDVIPSEHTRRLGFAGLGPRKRVQQKPIPTIRKPADPVQSHASTEVSEIARRRSEIMRSYITSHPIKTTVSAEVIGKSEPVKPAMTAPVPPKPVQSPTPSARIEPEMRAQPTPTRQAAKPARLASIREPTVERRMPGVAHFGMPPRMANAPAIPRPRREITVEYWDDRRLFRYVLEKVEMQKYIDLWQKGLLKFQREGTDKPTYYITPEEAKASLDSS
jgi:hypothetical protein